MANPRITYDGTDVDFPHQASPPWELGVAPRGVLEFTDGLAHAAALHSLFELGRIVLENFEDLEFERKLEAWWSWAARGNVYSVALDSADLVNTTLNGAAAAGATSIPLASTAGIVVGRRYRLREIAGGEFEAAEVATIVAGVSVTVTQTIKYGYVSGDVFKSRDYAPKVVSLDREPPWRRSGSTTFSFDHKFRQVL